MYLFAVPQNSLVHSATTIIAYTLGWHSCLNVVSLLGTEGSIQATLFNADDVDPKFMSGLCKIRIMHMGFMCMGRDRDLPICPDYTCPD